MSLADSLWSPQGPDWSGTPCWSRTDHINSSYSPTATSTNLTTTANCTGPFLPGLLGGDWSGNGTYFNISGLLWHLQKNKRRGDGFKQVLDFLNVYFTPVIILVGVVGNVMSFLVFSLTHLTRLSSSVYLAALSMADTGFLLALSVVWLSRVGMSVFTLNGWCQCTVYFTYVFSFLSVWNVVSFTAERYIIVYHPLRKDSFCTRKKAKCVVGLFVSLSMVMYTFALWTSGVVRFDTQAVCMPLPQYYDVITIMTSIDTLISCVIPSLVIVILNVRIIMKLHHYQKKRAELSATTLVLSTTGHFRRRSVLHTSISTTGSMHIKFSSPNKDGTLESTTTQSVIYPDNCKRVMRSRSQFRTARMLLILSSVFVLLNLPSHVFRVQVFVQNFVGGGPKAPKAKVHWKELFQLVYFLNFGINFFIYNACGRQFRNGLKRMCKNMTCEKPVNVLQRVASLDKSDGRNRSPEENPNKLKQPNISPV